MKGQVLANHYYMRSGIIRKSELATNLLRHLRACHPETHVADLVSASAREDFVALAKTLADRGGLWLLKAGDSSNATDMHLFDASRVSAISDLLRSTLRTSWLVQQYIDRPLLIRGFKFHIRAVVLAVGRLKVFLHRHAIALMASKHYSCEDLGDLAVHASNHSVAEKLNPDAVPQAVLLADLAEHVDKPLPPIVDLAALELVHQLGGA